MSKEMRIVAVPLVTAELFHQLRFNGIEATIPTSLADGKKEMYCLASDELDRLLCTWKDFISYGYATKRKK